MGGFIKALRLVHSLGSFPMPNDGITQVTADSLAEDKFGWVIIFLVIAHYYYKRTPGQA